MSGYLGNMDYTFLERLLVAALLGAIIGFERDLHGRPAGLRTNLLVSLGAALFMLISITITSYDGVYVNNDKAVYADPGRIAAQIVTGIGFLGAGAIIKDGFSVRGLTTAACLWIVAGIGMASGAGFYALAIAATVIALFSLVFMNLFEKYYSKDSYRTLELQTSCNAAISEIIGIIKRKNLKILHCDYERDYKLNVMTIKFLIRLFHKGATDKLSHSIVGDLEDSDMDLKSVKWTHD